jgi:hypothetical protein
MLAAIAAFGWLGTCSRLALDDYGWALGPPRAAMGMAEINYHEWMGCYSCIFFLSLLLPISPKVVMVLPAAALGLWLLGLLLLFRGVLANRPWSVSLLAATATLWATVDSTLSPGQSLYWANSMIRYTGPLVLLTFAAALIIAQCRTERSPGALGCTLTGLLLFVCGGFSETTLALQMTAVVVALLLSWTAAGNRPLRRLLVVSLIATAASALVVVLAPGNALRQAEIGPPSAKAAAAARALWYALLVTIRFFIWKPATAASVFAAGWLVARSGRSSIAGATVVRRRTAVCLLAAAALLTISFLPAAYVFPYFPPSRLLIAPQFILVLAVFACGAAAANATLPGNLIARAFPLLACTLLVGAPLWSTRETFQTRLDAARYAMLWDRRDQRLRTAAQAGQLDVVLDPLPMDLALQRGLPDGVSWERQYIALFYRLRWVRGDAHSSDEPWTHESWTRFIDPENFASAIRDIPKMIPESIRGTLRKVRGH